VTICGVVGGVACARCVRIQQPRKHMQQVGTALKVRVCHEQGLHCARDAFVSQSLAFVFSAQLLTMFLSRLVDHTQACPGSFGGITPEQCEAMGCCFSSTPSPDPKHYSWCYARVHPAGPMQVGFVMRLHIPADAFISCAFHPHRSHNALHTRA
jgi:hypothetical protein